MRAYTQEWFDHYGQEIENLLYHMADLGSWRITDPLVITEVHAKAYALWGLSVRRVGRHPRNLMLDCIYICAKLSGNRASYSAIKRSAKMLWNKNMDILTLDRRRDTRRWFWDYEAEIQSMFPDEYAWNDFVSEFAIAEEE